MKATPNILRWKRHVTGVLWSQCESFCIAPGDPADSNGTRLTVCYPDGCRCSVSAADTKDAKKVAEQFAQRALAAWSKR